MMAWGGRLGGIVMSAVHLHFSTWCEHVLHRGLGLESVHVDDLFDAVHPQAMFEQTRERGKMNLNERSRAFRLYHHLLSRRDAAQHAHYTQYIFSQFTE